MTQFLIDIASWQTTEKRPSDPLDLAKAKAAGFTLVNIKTSQGDWYAYRSWMGAYAERARRLGMGISTFHWLDNTADGAVQARIAFDRMRRLGGPDGMAHQCDCEDTTGRPATFDIWRDYVNAMQDLLGRPIVNYTGDWWWKSKGWTGAGVTPYLWAAPNVGYLGKYPGDGSSHWHAGYGGWNDYAVLQYAVSPISGAGGGNLSKSAIRDPRIWAALTGQSREDDMPTIDEVRAAVRQELAAARRQIAEDAATAVLTRKFPDYVPAADGSRPPLSVSGALFAAREDALRGRAAATASAAGVSELAGKDFTDEEAIAEAVLARLGGRTAADVLKALQAAGVDLTALRDELAKLPADTPVQG